MPYAFAASQSCWVDPAVEGSALGGECVLRAAPSELVPDSQPSFPKYRPSTHLATARGYVQRILRYLETCMIHYRNRKEAGCSGVNLSCITNPNCGWGFLPLPSSSFRPALGTCRSWLECQQFNAMFLAHCSIISAQLQSCIRRASGTRCVDKTQLRTLVTGGDFSTRLPGRLLGLSLPTGWLICHGIVEGRPRAFESIHLDSVLLQWMNHCQLSA